MWHIFVCIFLWHCFKTTANNVIVVPVIHNVSLQMFNASSTIINGTCHECFCALISNTTLISFNCFENNKTCEMFSKPLEMDSFSLVNDSTSSVYFLSLPIFEVSLRNTFILQYTSSLISKSIVENRG